MHKGQKKKLLETLKKSKPDCNSQILVIYKVINYNHFSKKCKLGKCLNILEIEECFLFTLRLIPDALAMRNYFSR